MCVPINGFRLEVYRHWKSAIGHNYDFQFWRKIFFHLNFITIYYGYDDEKNENEPFDDLIVSIKILRKTIRELNRPGRNNINHV